MSTRRTRNYSCILYPESADSDFGSKLKESHVPFLLSPLHDQDKDCEGNTKKAHYHLIVCYDSVKTIDQFIDLVKPLGGVMSEPINCLRSYGRYLCHLDDPEKFRYPIDQVESYNIDYLEVINQTSDRYEAISDMQDYCDQNNIYSFSELCKYCRTYRPDWFRLLCDNSSVIMQAYLKSKAWTDSPRGESKNQSTEEPKQYDTAAIDSALQSYFSSAGH